MTTCTTVGLDIAKSSFQLHGIAAKRNGDLRGQLAAVVGALNRAGVEPVLLKGAIRLVDGLYPDPGWRIMRDLDLLVPGDRLGDAVAALGGAGYAPQPPMPGEPPRAGHHHYPELTRPDHRATVEVHAELFKTERQRRLLRAAEVSGASRPMGFDGVRARLPSVDHQIVHLVGHSQISNFGHYCARVQLRDRFEAAALEQWSPERPGWAGIADRFAAAGYRHHLESFLASLDDAGFPCAPAGCCGSRPACADLRLVHRGIRHRRPQGRQGTARRARLSMSGSGYAPPSETAAAYGRFPGASRPSNPNVSS